MANQDEVATREQELAEYLQERIKPGLNRGAIPLVARSIAKELVAREQLNDASDERAAEEELDEPAEAEADRAADADNEPDDEARAGTDDEPSAEADEEPEGELDDEPDADGDDETAGGADEEPEDESQSPLEEFEAEMHELQEELGEDWILRFSVQGDEAWLTAEKQDGSQHVEGPTAEVLLEAVELLDESGGRSG
jgi:hypothetical protein